MNNSSYAKIPEIIINPDNYKTILITTIFFLDKSIVGRERYNLYLLSKE
jgi:hypothetical protein